MRSLADAEKSARDLNDPAALSDALARAARCFSGMQDRGAISKILSSLSRRIDSLNRLSLELLETAL